MGGGGGGSQAFRKLGFFSLFVGFNRVSMSPRINISPAMTCLSCAPLLHCIQYAVRVALWASRGPMVIHGAGHRAI